jgi:hypothetical protein
LEERTRKVALPNVDVRKRLPKIGRAHSSDLKKASTKRKGYPKCVPRSKAMSMTKGERASAVRRKRAKAQGVGGKPTNVKTFTKKKKRR